MWKNKLLLGVILLMTSFMVWKSYLPARQIIGSYVNNNTEPVLEGPASIDNGRDTLILFEDKTFVSKTWGTGVYRLGRGFWEKEFKYTYTYELGKAGGSTHISKSLFGRPRIWLSRDQGFYFEKID